MSSLCPVIIYVITIIITVSAVYCHSLDSTCNFNNHCEPLYTLSWRHFTVWLWMWAFCLLDRTSIHDCSFWCFFFFFFFKLNDRTYLLQMNWTDRVASIQLAFLKKKKKKSFWLVCSHKFIYMTVKWRACLETCCLCMCEKKLVSLQKRFLGGDHFIKLA